MSALLALSGFVIQFVGLGAMHWSATVTVVSVSILMTIVRAVVRRGLANDPRCISIPEKFELIWVALRVTRDDWDKIQASPQSGLEDCEWGLLTGFIEPRLSDGTSICDTKQDAKQNTKQNANQDEKQDAKQDAKQDLNQGANLEANSITDANVGTDVNADVLEFNSMITDATRYMRQLHDPSHQHFVLGFRPVSHECPETKAIKDIISTTPNIPLGDFHDLAGRLADAMKGMMDYLGEISGNGIIWQGQGKGYGGHPPFKGNSWQVDVQQSLGVKTSWVIRTNWEKDDLTLLDRLRVDLNAGLSLWMHSIACTNSFLKRLYSCHDMLRNDKVTDLPSFREVSPKEGGRFPRIVGAGFKTYEELREWMPNDVVDRVPRYDGKWWNEKENKYFYGVPQQWRRAWPVFGLFFSNSFK